MTDIHDRYLQAVGDLLKVVGPTDTDYLTALTLQGRLAEAISEIRRYGPTDNTRAEIARVTTELDRLCLAHCGQSFRGLCGEAGIPATAPSRIHHNLPHPDYGRFVGREQELTRIHELLSPRTRHFLITIDGVGGIGKSALALEVAHRYLNDAARLPESDRFEAIIWASAKQTILTDEGVVQRKQMLRTLDDIYTAINVTLQGQDISRIPPDQRHAIIRRTLTKQRTLLIIDNLETIDDEDVMAFLRELPIPTKAIVTTRHRLDVAYPVRLAGMPPEDAMALITLECEKKNVTLTEEQARRLYDRTGGVPLALVWSIAQIGWGYDVDSVLRRLGQPTNDVSRFCFENSMLRIRGTDTHRVLMALSLFLTNPDREALGFVAGFGDDVTSRDEALMSLEKLSLISKQGEAFFVLPLVAAYVLSEEPEFAEDVYERLIEFWLRTDTWKAVQHWAQLGPKAPLVLKERLIQHIDQNFWTLQDAYYLSFWVRALESIGGSTAAGKLSAAVWDIIGVHYEDWATTDCIEALGRLGEYETLVSILERTRHQKTAGYIPVRALHRMCVDALSGCTNETLLQKVSWVS